MPAPVIIRVKHALICYEYLEVLFTKNLQPLLQDLYVQELETLVLQSFSTHPHLHLLHCDLKAPVEPPETHPVQLAVKSLVELNGSLLDRLTCLVSEDIIINYPGHLFPG